MQMPMNKISVDVATAAAHGTMFTLSRDQLAASAPWPHIGHHNAQWASNSGNLNWQQQWRGRGEAGRLGGTVPGTPRHGGRSWPWAHTGTVTPTPSYHLIV